jgi:hypothetical protein
MDFNSKLDSEKFILSYNDKPIMGSRVSCFFDIFGMLKNSQLSTAKFPHFSLQTFGYLQKYDGQRLWLHSDAIP